MLKRVRLLGAFCVLSGFALMLLGGASANNQYVRLATKNSKVAVYQVPGNKRYKFQTLSKSIVYQQVGSQRINKSYYIKVKSLNGGLIGWVPKQNTKKWSHIKKNGLLKKYRVQKLNGQLRLKNNNKKVYIDVQGPQATVKKMTYRKVMAQTLTTNQFQVVKSVQTDLGRYFQLKKNHKAYGWVKSTAFMYETASTVQRATISSDTLQKIDNLMNNNHLKGTMVLTKNGIQDAITRSYGYENSQKGILNSGNSIYPIASLQKAITGAMIGQLIQSKQLTMQTPLSRFYPQIKFSNTITISELLTHTSGIRMSESTPPSVLSESGAIQWALQHLTSTGQYTWAYTNANYTLLAGIIMQITKQSYWQNVNNRILKPLGMNQTFTVNNLPKGYALNAYKSSVGDYTQPQALSLPLISSELGAGNLLMSATDYERFVSAYNNSKLFSSTVLQELSLQNEFYSGGYYYVIPGLQYANGSDNYICNFYYGTRDNINVVLFVNQTSSYMIAKKITIQIESMLEND